MSQNVRVRTGGKNAKDFSPRTKKCAYCQAPATIRARFSRHRVCSYHYASLEQWGGMVGARCR